MVYAIQFTNRPEGFLEIRRRILFITVSIFLVTFIGIGSLHLMNAVSSKDVNAVILSLLISAPILLGVSFIGMNAGIARALSLYGSYVLTIKENLILQEQVGNPGLLLFFSEIKKISKTGRGDFIIQGNSANHKIIVSRHIENSEELEEILNRIHPIQYEERISNFSKSLELLGKILLGIGYYIPMVAVIFIQNKLAIVFLGVTFFILIGYSSYQVFTSKNVDFGIKKSYSVLLLIPTGLMLIFLYLKLAR